MRLGNQQQGSHYGLLYKMRGAPQRLEEREIWNVGYAFVNFFDPYDAQWFMEVMAGYRFRTWEKRYAHVRFAHDQGFKATFLNCRKSCTKQEQQPWVHPSKRNSTEMHPRVHPWWQRGLL